MQEEIKITSVTVFVNPYTELDEEEQEKAKDEKDIGDEENVTFWAPFGVERSGILSFFSLILVLRE